MLRVSHARITVDQASPDALWTRDFVLITFANFVVFASMQSLVPALPLYVEQLGTGDTLVGLVSGVFAFTAVAIRPWLGTVLDQRGRKIVMICSVAVFVAAGLLYPLAASIPALLVVRLLQGVGWGGVIPAAGAIVADVVPEKRRGEGIGYFSLSPTLAIALAPAAGLILARDAGFGSLFIASAVWAALAGVLVLPLHDHHPQTRARNQSARLFELSTLAPCLVAGLLAVTMGGLTTFVVIDAGQRSIGDPSQFFVLYALVLLLTRPIAGRISDRRGRGQVLVPAVVLTAAGLLVLGAMAGPLTLPTAAILYGTGFGSALPSLQALAIDRASPTRHGAAMAAFYIAFDLGVGVGSILFGVLGGVAGLPVTFELASGLGLATLGLVLANRLHRA